MIALFCLFLTLFASPFKSKSRLAADVLLEATQCQGCHCLLSRVQHFSCNAHTTPCDNFPFLLSSRADYDPVGMSEARGRVLPPS